MKENYADAWNTVREIIDRDGLSFPKHQGVTDITEVIDFAEIAGIQNLTEFQCDNLIEDGAEYFADVIEIQRRDEKNGVYPDKWDDAN